MNQFQIHKVWLKLRLGFNLVLAARATPTGSQIVNPSKSIASQNSANSQTSQGFTDQNGLIIGQRTTAQTESVYPEISLQTGASHQSHLEMVSSHRIVIEPTHIKKYLFMEFESSVCFRFRPGKVVCVQWHLILGQLDNLKSQKLLDSELKYDDQLGFQIDAFTEPSDWLTKSAFWKPP